MATQTGSFDFKAAKLAKDSAEATASADATAKANQAEANAKKVATNFLSQDSSGVMVYDGTSGTQTPSSPSAGTKNVLIDSNGMYVRNGSTNLASFTGSSAQIGQDSAAHSVVDTNGMRIYASNGSTSIANLGYGPTFEGGQTVDRPYYTFGTRETGQGNGSYSFAQGYNVRASGSYSQAMGNETKATADDAHAEGYKTTAGSICAHAEGGDTTASGQRSHAEGTLSTASGFASHAENQSTTASGNSSHAEGIGSVANGESSHAQNSHTIANGYYQTALGKYNVADTTNAVIIGNGTADDSRSNALTVDWNGNVNIASGAKYKINGNNLSASDIANSVTGVKGNSESSYRTGNVNLTPANIGAVPTSRTVNSKALSANITLSASDVGAPATGDTAWKTLETNFNYIKRSGIVTVDFYKSSQALSTSWTTLGTLPSGYRPAHTLYGSAMSLTTTPLAYYINSSGTVAMRTASGSGNYATGFTVSFPVL